MPNGNESSNDNIIAQYQVLLDQKKSAEDAFIAAEKDVVAKREAFLKGTLPSMETSGEQAHFIVLNSLKAVDDCREKFNQINIIISKFEKDNPNIVSMYKATQGDAAPQSSQQRQQPLTPPAKSSAPVQLARYRTNKNTSDSSASAPLAVAQQAPAQTESTIPQPLPESKGPMIGRRRPIEVKSPPLGSLIPDAGSTTTIQSSPQRGVQPPLPPPPVASDSTMQRSRAGAIYVKPAQPVSQPAPQPQSPQHSSTGHVMEELAQRQKNVDPMQRTLQPIQSKMDLLRQKVNECEVRRQQAREDGSYLSTKYVEQFKVDNKEINRLAKDVRAGLRPEMDNIAFRTRDKTIDTLPKDNVTQVKAMQGIYDSLMLSMHEMETPIWAAELNAIKEKKSFTDLQRQINEADHAIDELSKKTDISPQEKEKVNKMITACEDQLKTINKEVGNSLYGMELMTGSMKQIMQRYPQMKYENSTAAKISGELTKIQHENSSRGTKLYDMRERLDAITTKLDNPSPASSPRGTTPG
jgi:hypothetical protein